MQSNLYVHTVNDPSDPGSHRFPSASPRGRFVINRSGQLNSNSVEL